jgi:hypothetical protein
MAVVRRTGAKLAAVAAGLVAVGAFGAVPAAARHNARGDGSDAGKQWSDTDEQSSDAGQQSSDADEQSSDAGQQSSDADEQSSDAGQHVTSADPVVSFRRNAIFSCFGADGTGTPTANTANISATLTTIKAVVTVHARAGTTVFGELWQSGCLRPKFFSFMVPASGVGTATVTDLRVSNDAFVSFSDTIGEFQITPEVVF